MPKSFKDELQRRKDLHCGKCGKEVYYVRAADFPFHQDGSDNDKCWVAIIRGEVWPFAENTDSHAPDFWKRGRKLPPHGQLRKH